MEAIELVHTKCVSQIVFVPKQDCPFRFGVYYQKLNAVRIRDSYPIPCMDEHIKLLGDATLLLELGAKSRCCKVK